jgi:hypothetical protein
MPVTVKRITLWRKEIDNQTGTLAETLQPLAKVGADLQVVMGYRYPGEGMKAAVEVYPITNKKAMEKANEVGLAESSIPTLLVEGDNKAGLGHLVAQAIASAGINMAFLVTQVIGRKYSSVVGFENEADAKTAVALIKKTAASKKK